MPELTPRKAPPPARPAGGRAGPFLEDQKGPGALPEYLRGAEGSLERYPGGALRSVLLLSEAVVPTPLGPLAPNCEYGDVRKKYAPSITFYESGALRSVRLLEKTDVATPLGTVPCEKLVFYEGGALKRLFPTDGKISGYWSLSDEKRLCPKVGLSLKFGSYSLRLSILSFYEAGGLKSAALWPGEALELPLPLEGKPAPVGAGFSLYESGGLKSLEPKRPVKVKTPLGELEAFDPFAAGVTADANSLEFGPGGEVSALKSLVVLEGTGEGGPFVLSPAARIHPLDELRKVHHPLRLRFEGGSVRAGLDLPGEPEITAKLGSVRTRPYVAHRVMEVRIGDRLG